MSDFNRQPGTVPTPADMAVDQGLRSFVIGVYNKLALGLLVSGLVAYGIASSPAIMAMMYRIQGGEPVGYNALGYAVAFAPLGLILASNFLLKNPSPASAGALYWSIVTLVGASMAVLLYLYTGPSIAFTLGVTALSFGGLSLIGYTTKRNLGPVGNFLGLALWGLVISFIISMFLPASVSPVLFLVMNGIGVLLSAGLIAVTTQSMKMSYYATLGDERGMQVASTFSALNLFIQFSNLFRFLLAFVGVRR